MTPTRRNHWMPLTNPDASNFPPNSGEVGKATETKASEGKPRRKGRKPRKKVAEETPCGWHLEALAV